MIMLIALILMTPMLVVMLCALVYGLAVYALPYKLGLAAAHFAYVTGAGEVGAGLAGLAVGVGLFHILAHLFATLRAPGPRIAIALAFAGPAAMAGYALIHDVIGDAVPSLVWRQIFCIAAGAFSGLSALARLAAAPSGSGQLRAITSALANGRHDP